MLLFNTETHKNFQPSLWQLFPNLARSLNNQEKAVKNISEVLILQWLFSHFNSDITLIQDNNDTICVSISEHT